MNKILVLMIVIMLSACTATTPQSELNDTMTEMIALIDQGKGQDLLKNHVDLSDLHGPLPRIPDDKLKRIKVFLLKAKKMNPKFKKNNTLAVYRDSSFFKPLRFKKINGKWLLMN